MIWSKPLTQKGKGRGGGEEEEKEKKQRSLENLSDLPKDTQQSQSKNIYMTW